MASGQEERLGQALNPNPRVAPVSTGKLKSLLASQPSRLRGFVAQGCQGPLEAAPAKDLSDGAFTPSCQHYRYLTKKHQQTSVAQAQGMYQNWWEFGSKAARLSWKRLAKFLIGMAASVPISSALFCSCNTFPPSLHALVTY